MGSTSKVLVSVMMSASLSFEVKTVRHQQSILPKNNGETHLHSDFRSRPSETRSICQKHVWNSGCFAHLAAWAVRTASVESTCFVSSKDECFECGKTNTVQHCFYSPKSRGENGNAV